MTLCAEDSLSGVPVLLLLGGKKVTPPVNL